MGRKRTRGDNHPVTNDGNISWCQQIRDTIDTHAHVDIPIDIDALIARHCRKSTDDQVAKWRTWQKQSGKSANGELK